MTTLLRRVAAAVLVCLLATLVQALPAQATESAPFTASETLVLQDIARLMDSEAVKPVLAGIREELSDEQHPSLADPDAALAADDTLISYLVGLTSQPESLDVTGIPAQYEAFVGQFQDIAAGPAYTTAVAKVNGALQPGTDAWVEYAAALAREGINPYAVPQSRADPFGFVGTAIGGAIAMVGIGLAIVVACTGTVFSPAPQP